MVLTPLACPEVNVPNFLRYSYCVWPLVICRWVSSCKSTHPFLACLKNCSCWIPGFPQYRDSVAKRIPAILFFIFLMGSKLGRIESTQGKNWLEFWVWITRNVREIIMVKSATSIKCKAFTFTAQTQPDRGNQWMGNDFLSPECNPTKWGRVPKYKGIS